MFQPFLRFYSYVMRLGRGVVGITEFQPFLRFYLLGALVVGVIAFGFLFQPFLRFYTCVAKYARRRRHCVSTLLEILLVIKRPQAHGG